MTAIRFYHLQTQRLDQALPLLLEKAREQGHNIVVMMDNNTEVERMVGHLWTYKADNFLPHGAKKDGYDDQQPIWITDQDENPNKASVLFLTQGRTSSDIGDYDLCCEVFDGRNNEAVSQARTRWAAYKEQGYDLTYWQQSETGQWNKQAG